MYPETDKTGWLTAAQASEIAKTVRNPPAEASLPWIMADIRAAANQGMKGCSTGHRLNPALRKALEDLGYTVNPCGDRQHAISISWE